MIAMYDRSSTATCVNDARLELFARKQKSYQSIPPTRAALVQHLKPSAYQAGCIWSQATVCKPETLSSTDWGWIKETDVWKTCWSTLPPIATSCQELTKCGCKRECHGNCKCYRFGLSCTALCSCTCLDKYNYYHSHGFNWFVFSYVETNFGGITGTLKTTKSWSMHDIGSYLEGGHL